MDQFGYYNFFECIAVAQDDDDTIIYAGPHCSSDKSTIVIGAFSDQYCSNYVGDDYDIRSLTGLDLNDASLMEYYNSDCIACKESDLPFQQVDNDAEDNDDITEICENLYYTAAKCNRYIGDATDESYQSYQQEANSVAVCSFITSVVTGSYDEQGYIYMNPAAFSADNKYNEYAAAANQKSVVTGLQIVGLTSLSILLVGLLFYASLLRSSVAKKTHKKILTSAPDVSGNNNFGRQNSGIMMCRSNTNDSNVNYVRGTLA